MTGLWRFYHNTGKIKDEVVIQGNNYRVINSYSKKGDTLVNIGNGDWSYEIKSWDGQNDMYVTGSFINGMKDGEWILKDDKNILVEEFYENGKFIKGKYYKKKKTEKTFEPLITPWIFSNPYLIRIEQFLLSKEKVKEYYPFIKF